MSERTAGEKPSARKRGNARHRFGPRKNKLGQTGCYLRPQISARLMLKSLALLLFLSSPLLAQPTRPGRPVAPPPHPFADPVRRRIATAQDERQTAALVPSLADKNPTYRAAAALALASVQDRAATAALLPLLRDAVPAVRRAAAFALGQTGDSTAVPALAARLTQAEASPAARRAAFEALGCCVTRRSVSELWTVKVPGSDSATAPGRAWGLYRATVRGLASAEVVRQATALLGAPHASLAARRGASAVFTRARGQDSVVAQVALPVLLKLVASDPDYFVRANCASGLGRVARPAAYNTLATVATNDADHRVHIAAIRALPATPRFFAEAPTVPVKLSLKYKASVVGGVTVGANVLILALKRPLSQEALAAAEWFLKAKSDTLDTNLNWLESARATTRWRARATLLQAALRHARAAQRPALTDTIRRRYKTSQNQYERAALLTALSEDPAQFDFLAKEAALTTGPPVVPGAALAALVSLRENKRFPVARQADFTGALRRALAGGDVAQLSTAAEALANPALVPAPGPDDAPNLAALRQAQQKLTLPRDIEPWLSLQQALDKLEKRPAPTPAPVGRAGQHPIDWALVQRIPVGQRVRLTTTQGDIVLELKVAEAPGSVASFVSLVEKHFYDGLYFHRVVPNFVAQGGDPRGDGSGSTPYTLRSEFSELTYGEGAVGLASAGKDTESCQFFFTHQPTPHLDGRYTIFAQVVSGMSVVQRLEIGDKILTASLVGR